MNITGDKLYIIGLICGAGFGVVLRQTFQSDEMRHTLYRSFSSFSIGFLLPIHIFSSIVRQESLSDVSYFLVLFVLGAACCFSILLLSHIITRYTSLSGKYYPHYQYMASTFAGGGKAVIILAAIMPLVSGVIDKRLLQEGTALDALAIFDCGYWLFYTLGVYQLMGFSFNNGLHKETLNKKFGWENVSIIIAVIVAVLSQLFVTKIVETIEKDILDLIRWIIVTGIVMFSAAAITLQAEFSQWRGTLEGILLILLLRVLGLTIPFIIIISVGNWAALVWLPVLLFLISPPSTWVDRMLAAKGATEKQIAEAATINLVWNLGVFITLTIGVVFVFYVQFFI